MAEKKEVLEYLRNQQKAAEIDAKVNGINSWVLLGAMTLIAWNLLGIPELSVLSDYELLVRVLVAGQGALFIVQMCGRQRQTGGSVRFTSWQLTDMDAPYLHIIHGLVLICPAGILIVLYKDYTAILVGVIGLTILITGCTALFRLIRGDDVEGRKFPEPTLVGSQRVTSIIFFIFIIGWVFTFIYQGRLAIDLLKQEVTIEYVKVIIGVVALYVLLLLAIQRRLFGESIKWSYILETELLLDTVSPDIALRRIEHRALGPRLQDVMDRFFDGLDQKFSELEGLRDDCLQKLIEISSIPKEYVAERNSRITTATENFNNALAEIDNDCKELSAYLERLKSKNLPNISHQIKGIEVRKMVAVQRLREWKEWLERSKREPIYTGELASIGTVISNLSSTGI